MFFISKFQLVRLKRNMRLESAGYVFCNSKLQKMFLFYVLRKLLSNRKYQVSIIRILGHPNVKVFISHGGMLGTIEAIYNGKPIVVIPQFGDQAHNARKLERKGVGVFLDMRDATEEAINAALAKALDSE